MYVFFGDDTLQQNPLKIFSPLVLDKYWIKMVTLTFLCMSVAVSSKKLSFRWMLFPA